MSNTRKQRLWLLTLALAVAAGLTAWLWWDRAHQPPPQIITLPNGDRYRFAGVTFSTRNVPPTLEAHIVSWLPAPLAKLAKRFVGKRISQLNEGRKLETPRLFVWFQRLGTNSATRIPVPNIKAMLADQAGVEAGASDAPGFASGVTWCCAQFPVLPRRSRVLQATLYSVPFTVPPTPPAIPTSVRIFTFPNPLYGHFDQWRPEPVPVVKQAGELQVRLHSFAAGNPYSGSSSLIIMSDSGDGYRPAIKGQHAFTGFDWSLVSPRGTNESWVLHAAELGDATGNVLRDSYRDSWSLISGQPPVIFRPPLKGTLWPDEAAWRLKLVFKRASGIAPGELVTFTNVPVPAMGATNELFLKQTVGGIEVALTEFVQQPDMGLSGGAVDTLSRIKFELPVKSAGLAVDFLETTPGVGTCPDLPYFQSGSSYVFYLKSIPTNVQTMYFTFAVQKTRSVEFLVKPPKGQ